MKARKKIKKKQQEEADTKFGLLSQSRNIIG